MDKGTSAGMQVKWSMVSWWQSPVRGPTHKTSKYCGVGIAVLKFPSSPFSPLPTSKWTCSILYPFLPAGGTGPIWSSTTPSPCRLGLPPKKKTFFTLSPASSLTFLTGVCFLNNIKYIHLSQLGKIPVTGHILFVELTGGPAKALSSLCSSRQ